LPKRFPVGTTYVVEGHVVKGHSNGAASETGALQVFSRYIVLPSGRRINLGTNVGGPAPRSRRAHSQKQAPRRGPAKRRPAR
jgi:hypothetical protein